MFSAEKINGDFMFMNVLKYKQFLYHALDKLAHS